VSPDEPEPGLGQRHDQDVDRDVDQDAGGELSAPAPLLVASALVLVEGLLLLILGVTELVSLDSERLTMGITVTAFFVGFAAVLLLCAWGLRQLRTWARGPVLLTQLVQLGLAWNFRASVPIALALAVVAAIVLAGVLHPSSVQALERAAERG
ncbi:MAG: hypothetical protein JOZ82_10345, partial [Marmoricola sp.]|nr:hypothetical protein [Marmoricola sp.]